MRLLRAKIDLHPILPCKVNAHESIFHFQPPELWGGGVAGTRPHAPITLRFLLGTPHKYRKYIRKYIFDIITVSK